MQTNQPRPDDNAPDLDEPKAKDSLPSLSSIFKPEEFFDLEPIEEAALSIVCCNND